MSESVLDTTQYFASMDSDELAKQVMYRVKTFDDYVLRSGRLALWARSYTFYNRAAFTGARLNRTGENAEYTENSINHYRNLLQHILNLVTGQKPSFDARATNTDYQSMAQTIVANRICDHYNRVKNMGDEAKTAVENCLQFGDAYIFEGWDFEGGDTYTSDANGTPQKSGDVYFKNFIPMDVIFDFVGAMSGAKPVWHVVRDFKNKWDLVSQFPDQSEKILRSANDQQNWRKYFSFQSTWNHTTDYVPVYTFIHDRTPAMPDGRFFTCVADDCWLIDGAMPSYYKTSPLKRLTASEQVYSGFGYSPGYDLLPIQEGIDGLHSVVTTNQSTFGVQNITVPVGTNVSTTEIMDGLNLIEYDSKLGKPEALNLLSTPKEIFVYIDKLEATMQTLSGINSVIRGNPEASLKSGSALALVQSQALQFISGLQESYIRLLEDLGTGLIDILKVMAQTPRMIEVAGKVNRSYMKEFKADDIASVVRVTVDVGNPVSRTTAGKIAIAENLLNAGMIKNPQEYIQTLTTGVLEPTIEGEQAELMLIRTENEKLSEGVQIPVILFDNHPMHVLEHKSVLANVDGRMDPNVVQNVLNHIQEHINVWRTTDPLSLQLAGITPPPPQVVPPQPKNGSNEQEMNPQNPIEASASNVNMPNLPANQDVGGAQ